jgi:hypothetical protein
MYAPSEIQFSSAWKHFSNCKRKFVFSLHVDPHILCPHTSFMEIYIYNVWIKIIIFRIFRLLKFEFDVNWFIYIWKPKHHLLHITYASFFLWPNSYLDSLTKKRNTSPIPISALKSRTTETNGQVGVSILIQFVILTVSEHDVPVMHMPRILQLIKPIILLPMNHRKSKHLWQLLVRHF